MKDYGRLRKYIVITFLIAIISCDRILMSAHPHASKTTPSLSVVSNFTNECATKFDYNSDPEIASYNYDRCSDLMHCLDDELKNTVLTSYKSLSTFEKIKPPGSRIAVPITEMQANAQKAGPKAIAMVNQISGIRTQCLVSTGLNEEYQ